MRIYIPAGPLLCALALLVAAPARADRYSDAEQLFRNAGESAAYSHKSYGYALFPTIGKAGFGAGVAHGSGRVYAQGTYMGSATMNQVSVGMQLGGQAYSQIIFFEDQRAFEEFTSGNFEFGANAGAVAITSAVSASAGTTGANAAASAIDREAQTAGEYHKGMAVFTIAKGGLMYEASISGQKFSYQKK